MIIVLQFVAVKLAKISSRHLQMLMPCPSHSTSHEFELLGDITVPRYLDQLEMFKYHCCQNRKRGLNFLIRTSWLIFSNQDKQTPGKKTNWNTPSLWANKATAWERDSPFLPAGQVLSPGGCESCLLCGPYACAPVHCGVPVCLPAITRVTGPSAGQHSGGGTARVPSSLLPTAFQSKRSLFKHISV